MKLGITGLSGSGKTTVFEALTGSSQDGGNTMDARIGTIRVPDTRIDALSEMYQPKKTIYAQVEYFLPGKSARQKEGGGGEGVWTQVRDCDALIHVIRNFSGYGLETPTPEADATTLDQELIISDLVVVEKRLERLENDRQRGKTINPEEKPLLEACREMLEAERPLRLNPELAAAPALRGFAFLSAKPMLLLLNNADEDDNMPESKDPAFTKAGLVIKGKLEQELSQMTSEEAEEFLAEFNITASATDRVIQRSYELMGLMSFFTVGEDEVRAWTIKKDTEALDAAEVIHSDIKKGFIRAEVVGYEDLMSAGTYAEARKQGTVRLEGKTYPMKDGDIVNFRFNV
jgi:GTP-binding protein YchF